MSAPPFPNIWQHRKVADTAAKSCDICLKPSTSVLVTPEKQDFFYVCLVHLKDTRFCKPLIDEEAIAARKKKEMDAEIERVKKEYEEKQRKKKEKEKEKEKEDEKSKSEDKEKDTKADGDKKDDSKKDEVNPSSETKLAMTALNVSLGQARHCHPERRRRASSIRLAKVRPPAF